MLTGESIDVEKLNERLAELHQPDDKPVFTAEDFSDVIDKFGDREFITSSYGDHEELCEVLVGAANARLRRWARDKKEPIGVPGRGEFNSLKAEVEKLKSILITETPE